MTRPLTVSEGTGETVNFSGIPMLTSFKHLKVNGWILATDYPVSEVHRMILDLEKKILAAALIGIVCLLIAIFYLIRYLTFPLVTFTRHVEALPENGTADTHLDINTHDEIGTLSKAFNTMIADLDRQKKALTKSEEKYRTIFNSANDSLFIQDVHTGAILDVNQKMCRVWIRQGGSAADRRRGVECRRPSVYNSGCAEADLKDGAGGPAAF